MGQGAIFPVRRVEEDAQGAPPPNAPARAGFHKPPVWPAHCERALPRTGKAPEGPPYEPDWLRSKTQPREFGVKTHNEEMVMSVRCGIIWPHEVFGHAE